MKKLTAIVCIIGMSMIGAQAIAADGPQAKKQLKKRIQAQTQTMSGTQSGTMNRKQTQTRSSY